MASTHSALPIDQNPPMYFVVIEIFKDAKEAEAFIHQTFETQTDQVDKKVEIEYKKVKEKHSKGEMSSDSHIIFVWREMGITGQDFEFTQLFERVYFIK